MLADPGAYYFVMNSIQNNQTPRNAVIYCRRSTVKTETDDKQKNSLEVQRASLAEFADRCGYTIVREFFDEASGRDNDRPGLLAALDFAVAHDTFVLTSRVDRVSRSVSFFQKLENVGLERLRFQQLGDRVVDPCILALLLVCSFAESKAISDRVKSTHRILRAKLGDDYRVGNPRLDVARVRSLEVRKARAAAFNSKMYVFIQELHAAGYTTLRQKADRMNSLGITTQTGKPWSTSTVRHSWKYGEQISKLEPLTA